MAQLSFLSVILLSAIRDLSLQHFHGVFLCGRLPPTFKVHGPDCAWWDLAEYCIIKFHSSRGVTRDPKSQFVNSSRALELRGVRAPSIQAAYKKWEHVQEILRTYAGAYSMISSTQ
jgi:hypothetical protein